MMFHVVNFQFDVFVRMWYSVSALCACAYVLPVLGFCILRLSVCAPRFLYYVPVTMCRCLCVCACSTVLWRVFVGVCVKQSFDS